MSLLLHKTTHELGIKFDHAPETVLGSIGVYLFDPADCDGETFVHVAILGYWLCDTQERIVEPDLYEFSGEQAEKIVEIVKGSDAPIWRNVALYVIADMIWADTESEVFAEPIPIKLEGETIYNGQPSPGSCVQWDADEMIRRAA